MNHIPRENRDYLSHSYTLISRGVLQSTYVETRPKPLKIHLISVYIRSRRKMVAM